MTSAASIAEDDAQLKKHAAAWIGSENLCEIARTEGLDFATAVLHDHILRVPQNAEFLKSAYFAEASDDIQSHLIGIVPGAFYQTHRDTGADGARGLAIARELGCEAEVIPVKSFGTLEENAGIILNWIEAHAGRRIALISLSKGSADVKFSLASPEAHHVFANVAAWISFSGIVQGTPLVHWLRQRSIRWWGVRLLLWWGGHDVNALKQLRYAPDSPLAAWPVPPAHLRIVHVFGLPLRHHLRHRWAFRGYERLASMGPNDGGGILLADLTQLPGIVCPIWGADHYLTPSWDVTTLLQGIVTTALSLPRHASQYETHPTAAPATRSSA